MITLTSKQTGIYTILVSLLLGVVLAPWPKPSFSQTVVSQEQAGSVLAIDKVTVQDGTIAGEIRNMLRSRHGSSQAPSAHIPVVEDFADRLAKKMHGEQGALWFEVVNRTASAHFIGGMPIAESAAKGVVDPYQRAFGYPGLHVMKFATRSA